MPASASILVVDDNPSTRALYLAVLRDIGAPLRIADSGAAALDQLAHHEFALLLLDIQMPGMDGFEVARRARADERTRHVPIVFLTASAIGTAPAFDGYALGAFDYLYKPVPNHVLRAKVAAFLALHRHQQELVAREARLRAREAEEQERRLAFERTQSELDFARRQAEQERANAAVLGRQAEELARLGREREDAMEKLRRLVDENGRFFTLTGHMLCIAGFDGRFRRLNPAWERTLGFSQEELLARPWLDWVHPEDRAATVAAGERLMLQGLELTSFENRYRTRDGAWRWLDWNCVPVPGENLIYGVALDVTERKRVEEELRHAQKMDAIGRLAGGVAHDFNNLLNVILGFSELALDLLDGAHPARARIVEVRKAGERAASLTSQLLAFSRKQAVERRPLSLHDLLRDLEKMLGRMIGEDVRLVLELGAEVGPVLADRGQLEQVVMNLAVNARDAMPRGGTLSIRTSPVEVSPNPAATHVGLRPGRYVEMRVSDTGCGMDAQVRAQIFEPFFTTKEPGKGTGLGLSTVYAILQQSGGTISVESAPGAGSIFTLRFPCALAGAAQAGAGAAGAGGAAPRSAGAGELVLVVEDEDSLRRFIQLVLESRGYRVLLAAEGDEAVRLLTATAEPVHLLLTDVVLPNVNGIELARRCAALRPETRVLFMSGYTEHPALGADARDPRMPFLQKPFSPSQLAAKVRELLDLPRGWRAPALG
ncbi:MAG: response regulator [Planctomycetes bacterium]|nr:response regulator [Planctomycetota bacterium]